MNNSAEIAPYRRDNDQSDLFSINGIKNIIAFKNPDQNIITYDFFFDESWNSEITTILQHFKTINDFKIEKIHISYRIRNIHIELKRKSFIK